MISSQQAHRQIERYFSSFNQQQFDQTAALFDHEGTLHPPFERPLQGPENILAYLKGNATNMSANPSEWVLKQTKTGCWQVEVKGNVVTAHFKVNVGWQFYLTPAGDIAKAHIKLLASLADLIALK